jgi:hypothetical protein
MVKKTRVLRVYYKNTLQGKGRRFDGGNIPIVAFIWKL